MLPMHKMSPACIEKVIPWSVCQTTAMGSPMDTFLFFVDNLGTDLRGAGGANRLLELAHGAAIPD